MTARRVPVVISIAGSDSGGGAGIQADLKAFAHAGVHGTTAITAVTVQNTQGVTGVHPIPPDVVKAQIEAVATDLGLDAVKIGMVGGAATIEAVAEALEQLVRRQHLDPRGDQLDREREAVEPLADLDDGAGVRPVENEIRAHGARALAEEPNRVVLARALDRVVCRDGERRERKLAFASDAQSGAARHKDAELR